MNITLMAHDKKKELMVQFCTAYKSILSKHSLSATAATGRLVSEATNLPVALFLSKNQGGHQQVDARIAYNEIDLVIMFSLTPTTPTLGRISASCARSGCAICITSRARRILPRRKC